MLKTARGSGTGLVTKVRLVSLFYGKWYSMVKERAINPHRCAIFLQ